MLRIAATRRGLRSLHLAGALRGVVVGHRLMVSERRALLSTSAILRNNGVDDNKDADTTAKDTRDQARHATKPSARAAKADQDQQTPVAKADKKDGVAAESTDRRRRGVQSKDSKESGERLARSAGGKDSSGAATSGSRGHGASTGGDGDGGPPDYPLLPSDKVLPLVVPKPLFPGIGVILRTNDAETLKVLQKLVSDPSWNQLLVVFQGRDMAGEGATLMKSTDVVHPVGSVCQLGTRRIMTDATEEVLHFDVLPLHRVKVGELISPVSGGGGIKKYDKDVTSFEPSAVTEGDETEIEQQQQQQQQPGVEEEDEVPAKPFWEKVDAQWMTDIKYHQHQGYAVDNAVIQDLAARVYSLLQAIAKDNAYVAGLLERYVQSYPRSGTTLSAPDFLADLAGHVSQSAGVQEILEETNVEERLRKAVHHLSTDISWNRMTTGRARRREPNEPNFGPVERQDQGPGGPNKGLEQVKAELLDKANKLAMPDEVRKVFDREFSAFTTLEHYNHTRSYLEWLTRIPWGVVGKDQLDMAKATEVLDKGHYGMQDVKDRIKEFIAVAKLSQNVDGKIILLVGPPGVGKTSIAQLIAKSLGRKLDRFSVGGLFDTTEIKGHRRTYVDSRPGRIISALSKTGTMNPVIVIDEIDKLMASNHHGNPGAALLEVLDPEQNSAFQDTYLEVPVDLSKVMFICTANDASVIPPPLLNRMEMIYVPGYVTAEKVAIAEGYLSPKALKNSGLEGANVGFTAGALRDLAQKYTEESGVRDLNKAIEKVYRKIAREFVEDFDGEADETAAALRDRIKTKSLTVDSNDLYRYLGPSNARDLHFDELSIGVARGCAFTSAGGASLYVESVLQEALSTKTTGKSIRTGMIRQVMDESLSVAYSFARMYVAKHYPRNKFFNHAVIHTHYPVGAIPKDGPSAGIVSATSLLSLALKQRVRSDVCMTGELTLTGRVLKIGGVREKAAAAKNDGVKHFILPEANMADWHELPDVVKEGLTPVPVKTYEDVFAAAFGIIDANDASSAWESELAASEADASNARIPPRPSPAFAESAV